LMVPVVTVTSTLLERTTADVRSVRETVDHTEHAHHSGDEGQAYHAKRLGRLVIALDRLAIRP
jgi:hypothetical protein